MRVRKRDDGDVPAPDTAWDEIVPGLWMGGHAYFRPDTGLHMAVVRDEFDVVLSLLRRPGHGPPPGVEHHVHEIPDAPLDEAQVDGVIRLAEIAQLSMGLGRSVLVRCHSGYNRSGLVVAHTLVMSGRTPEEAVELVRARRSPWALHNPVFEDYLETGLDVVRLLAGLSEP
ncbi:protein-tyrosine phosphatase family protein [Streptomyces sp. NPDC050738]|uniref:protein-tyrosine phosphatase family protein n=1 Tax=Streptomyces sp. NPDC050738 TaxID=3154744 RepID=UPI00343769C5